MRVKLLMAVLLASGAASAGAQTAGDLPSRVGKLEKEMKAVQRTVFPGGAPVQPEIGAASTPVDAPGDAASTPVADLTARVDALEKQIAALTGASEQNGFRVKQAEDALKALEARVKALEPTPVAAPAAEGGPEATVSKPTAVLAPARPAAATSSRPDPARKTAIAAVEMPATSDVAEDAYVYGYRLYAAKFYPEAQVRLKEFVAKYPKHKRASYAQNLLGRAYFDEGKPALASVAFYDNYQKMPKGERAPESLYWLGQSLTRLKKLPDACKVYDELDDVFGATLSTDLRAKATKGRADANCTA